MSQTLHSRPLSSSGTLGGSSTLHVSPSSLRSRAHDRYPVTVADEVRRALNVVVATFALIVTAPLMLVVAALVRLDSPGPVIYRQERVGLCRRGSRDGSKDDRRRAENLGGRVFTIFKFRTMTIEQDGVTGLAQVNLGYDTSIEDVRRKIEMDLAYIEGRSTAQDLLIMVKTVPVILLQKVWM